MGVSMQTMMYFCYAWSLYDNFLVSFSDSPTFLGDIQMYDNRQIFLGNYYFRCNQTGFTIPDWIWAHHFQSTSRYRWIFLKTKLNHSKIILKSKNYLALEKFNFITYLKMTLLVLNWPTLCLKNFHLLGQNVILLFCCSK